MPLSVSQDSSLTRSSPSADNAKEKSPAFQGASRAFNANARASLNLHNGRNEALAAASSVGLGGHWQMQTSSSEGLSPMSRQTTGQSYRIREPSPSHVAANLAASKAATRPLPKQEPILSSGPGRRRPSPLRDMPMGVSTSDGQSEEMPTPATKSLVKLYESKQGTPSRTQSVRYVSKPGPPIRSPKPIRPLARSNTSASILADDLPPLLVRTRPHAPLDQPNASRYGAAVAATYLAKQVSEATIGRPADQFARRKAPQVPPPRRRGRTVAEESESTVVPLEPRRLRLRAASQGPFDGAPQAPPDHVSKAQKSMSTVYHNKTPSGPAHFADSEVSPAPKPLPHQAIPSLHATKSFDKTTQPNPMPRNLSRETPRQLSSHMSVDSLANAMVASSLASSRAPSPTKTVPMLPPPRRNHLFHRNHSQELISRTPSPAKTMRHTMRKPVESDDDSERKKGKGHLVRKHQHKHHEGDRKRYRTQITERERKRYEGVWAANKGLFLPPDPDPTAPCQTVLNLVVRDIWRRSRLPDDVLEEVWELVSTQDSDQLGREEFVVGMWLIDQRLKGNKLPIKVSESVWASVRRLAGIKVPRNKH